MKRVGNGRYGLEKGGETHAYEKDEFSQGGGVSQGGSCSHSSEKEVKKRRKQAFQMQGGQKGRNAGKHMLFDENQKTSGYVFINCPGSEKKKGRDQLNNRDGAKTDRQHTVMEKQTILTKGTRDQGLQTEKQGI